MTDPNTDPLNDTTPISEQVFKEIAEMKRDLCRRLDRIEAMALQTRAELRDVEDRLEKIEARLTPIGSSADSHRNSDKS